MTKTRIAVLTALAVGISMPAYAHHSGAMFDQNTELSIEGTVKEWQWINPHAWLQLMTSDGKGGTIVQGFELGSPNTLNRNGFKKDSFEPGQHVKLTYHPRKDGSPGGEFGWAKSPRDGWLRWSARSPQPAG